MTVLSDMNLLVQATALVVDDSKTGVGQLPETLRRAGIGRVECAADPATAFADLQALLPDLLVAETQLSPLDGFELTNLVRTTAGPRLERIPVVLVARSMTSQDVARARSAGADDLVIAPVEEKRLRGRILRLFRARAGERYAGMPSFARLVD